MTTSLVISIAIIHLVIYGLVFTRKSTSPVPIWATAPVTIGLGAGLRLLALIVPVQNAGLGTSEPLSPYLCWFIELVNLLFLYRILAHHRYPPHSLILYAWNPLPILACAAGQPIVVVVCAVLAVLFCLRPSARAIGALPMWGLASICQPASVFLLPFVITRHNRYWSWLAIPFFAAIPFSQMTSAKLGSGVSMLDVISATTPLPLASLWFAIPAMLWGCWCTWTIKQCDDRVSVALICCWSLICLPGLGPWTLVLLAAVAVFIPYRSVLLLLLLSGLFWGSATIIAWILFTLVVTYDAIVQRQLGFLKYPTVKTMDIVIPTLNEADKLEHVLSNLKSSIAHLHTTHPAVAVHTVLVDGGSDDNTLAIAQEMGMPSIAASQKGRGNQFAEGIQYGSADLVLMLHADTGIREDSLSRLLFLFERNPCLEWGILGHVYEAQTMKMRLIQLSNRLRFHFYGVAFGDQGIFVRRSQLEHIQGMPPIKLMEDVEISLLLAAAHSRASLGNCLTASTRRWQKKKFSGYTWQVLNLVSTYLICRRLGRAPSVLADRMYDTYYGKQ